MRILKFAVVAALLILPVVSVQASVLGSFLSFDGSPDTLSDDSASLIQDVGTAGGQMVGNGFIDAGDVIQGLFELRTIDGAQTATQNATVLGVFALEVLSVSSVPSGFPGVDSTVLSLGAVGSIQAANLVVLDLTTLLSDGGFSTAGLTVVSGAIDPSIALIARNDGNSTILQGNPNSLPIDGSLPAFGLVGADWGVELLGGFDAIDDFYQITIFGGSGFAPPTIPVFPTSFNTAFSVVEHNLGAGAVFVGIDTTDEFGSSVTGDVISGTNTGIFAPGTTTAPNFDASDDGNFFINVVPEPLSIMVWGGLAIAGLAVRRRRSC